MTVVSEPLSRWTAVETIGKGVEEAPALKSGFGLTLALAMVGAAGRLAMPILVQQSVDKGFEQNEVKVGTITTFALIGLAAVFIGTLAQRTAVKRLGTRSEEALYTLRVRLFEHIHRLSIADHNEEKKGALVARVTGDVETLAQFFSWGALAWLLEGTLMLMVASVMLAYDWILALVAFVVAAPLGFVLHRVQRHLVKAYERARVDNAQVLTSISEVISGAETLRTYDAGEQYAGAHQARQPPPVELVHQGGHDRGVPLPVGRGVQRADRVVGGDRRVAARPRQRPHRRSVDRLRLPDLPVPRADRPVHRGDRPDPDRCRRAPAGAGHPRDPDRATRTGAPRAHPRRANSTSTSSTSRSPTAHAPTTTNHPC